MGDSCDEEASNEDEYDENDDLADSGEYGLNGEEEDDELDDGNAEDKPDIMETVPVDAFISKSGAYANLGPVVRPNSGDTGRVRDWGGLVKVADASILGNMKSDKNWPKADEFFPIDAIVVVKGRLFAEEVVPKSSKEGNFLWYARVVILGKEGGPDKDILRIIPVRVVKNIIEYLLRTEEYRLCSLVQDFKPYKDNVPSAAFLPTHNKWDKAIAVKSAAISPRNKAKEAPLDLKRKQEKLLSAEDEDNKPPPKAKAAKLDSCNGDGKKPEPAAQANSFKKKNALGFHVKKAAAAGDSKTECAGQSGDKKDDDGSCSTECPGKTIGTHEISVLYVKDRARTHIHWNGNQVSIIEF